MGSFTDGARPLVSGALSEEIGGADSLDLTLARYNESDVCINTLHPARDFSAFNTVALVGVLISKP